MSLFCQDRPSPKTCNLHCVICNEASCPIYADFSIKSQPKRYVDTFTQTLVQKGQELRKNTKRSKAIDQS
jgi:hypothetical protein